MESIPDLRLVIRSFVNLKTQKKTLNLISQKHILNFFNLLPKLGSEL